jgi:hypothetical protein
MGKSHAQKDEIIKKVLDGMSNDGLSCFKSCKKAGIPNSTFLLWVSEDKELADKYMRARDDLIERIANDAIEIADEPVGTTDSGATDSGAVQKQRLQVDTRKWLLSKLAPRKYGEKIQLAGDKENPIEIKSNIDTTKLSTETLAEIMAAKDAADRD